jgi:predicted metal-dependent phosphoesterase TrpH
MIRRRNSNTDLPAFLRAAHRAGLQRIAVTDHNTIRGALEAARMEP